MVDRYAYSGVAFTAAKGLPGLGADWCRAPDAGLPAPDAVVFLSLSAEAAAARGGYGEERYERAAFQQEVRVCDQRAFHGLKGRFTWVLCCLKRPLGQAREIVSATVICEALAPVSAWARCSRAHMEHHSVAVRDACPVVRCLPLPAGATCSQRSVPN